MDWLTWIFFESVMALTAFVAVVLFALLVWWRRRGRPQPLLIGMAICAGLYAAQVLVVTHRERAGAVLRAIESDLLSSHIDALADALADGFQTDPGNGDELGRDEFLEQVESLMQNIDIRWIERWQLKVEESRADRFTVVVAYRSDLVYRNTQASPRSNWTFTFVRTPEGWRIGNLRLVSIDGVRDPTWRRMRGAR